MTQPISQPSPPQPEATVTQVSTPAPTTKTRRKRRRPWLPVVAVLGLGLLWAVFRPHHAPASPVMVTEVSRGPLLRTVNGTGSAKAEISRTLNFPVTTTAVNVRRVMVKTGDQVQAGQALAQLDTSANERDLAAARSALQSAQTDQVRAEAGERDTALDQQRQRQNAQAAADSARAALQAADTALAQQKQLYQAGAVSQQSLQSAQQTRDDAARKLQSAQSDLNYALSKGNQSGQAAVSQARAAVAAAQVRLDNLEQAHQDATLVAPTAGVVSAVNVTAGSPPPSNQNAIEITNPAQLYLEVPFDETRSGDLRVGQSAEIQFDAVPGHTFKGTLSRVDPVAKSSGQVASVTVRIRLAQPQGVKPGFTGNATVTTRRLDNALLVPLETTIEASGKTQVWRVTKATNEASKGENLGTASPVTVSVLDRNASSAAVKGLQAGDLLVTPAPGSSLKPGQQVSIKTSSENAAP